MFSTWVLLLPFLSSLPALVQAGETCNATSVCASRAPCCSEFGFCGTDEFCLGGCNALSSHEKDSCKPAPVCRDATYTFADNSRILSNVTYYEGNATAHDWVLDSGNMFNTNSSGGELALTLTKENGGSRMSSTRYVFYGTITAKLKTGRWPGVVVAFITMSDIKDEIDWEFPGDGGRVGETNYFWQGVIPEKSNGDKHEADTETFSNYHDYTVNWQPETLTFLIDGKVVRTVKRSEAVVNGVSHYPSTPSRVQLSIWPAGIESSAPGTVEWAGGMIDYEHEDYKSAGQFYTLVKSIEIKCADTQPTTGNITSYVWGADSTSQSPVVIYSNSSTLLNGASGMHGAIQQPLQLWMTGLVGLLVVFGVCM
ncbi:glycoside hydrolase family 16 protein [Pterulicium gracile]|uniref:Glycoside hydrolase family 16 protein n=1 Tax=Pterulicium gracile TaxID=1884261 RepID=A0A5C3QV69_9AGAR|nr:glycoside hydrolase family 16 protein [Pterula gracilis]